MSGTEQAIHNIEQAGPAFAGSWLIAGPESAVSQLSFVA
jgi:hypothetical protein